MDKNTQIHKTRPKILPFVKIRNENDLNVLCLLLFVRLWSHLEAVLTSFRFRVVLSVRKNYRLVTS